MAAVGDPDVAARGDRDAARFQQRVRAGGAGEEAGDGSAKRLFELAVSGTFGAKGGAVGGGRESEAAVFAPGGPFAVGGDQPEVVDALGRKAGERPGDGEVFGARAGAGVGDRDARAVGGRRAVFEAVGGGDAGGVDLAAQGRAVDGHHPVEFRIRERGAGVAELLRVAGDCK